MTDPLLTIDEATREFRVSPKTIRRRLTAGEIAGAYKRPGNRGPEWVMPREALSAAGFSPRHQDVPVALPAGPEDRAAYWEQRAADAEAALRTPAPGATPASGGASPGGRRWWLLVGCALVFGLIAAVATLARDGGGEAPPAPAPDAMATVAGFLEDATRPGDAIGLVGQQRRDAVPTGRRVAATPRAGWGAAGGPRYVVATYDGASPPVGVAELRTNAALVLRAPLDAMVVDVYDRQAAPDGATPAGEATPPTSEDPDTLDVSSTESPDTTVVGAAAPEAPPVVAGEAREAPTIAPDEVVVEHGESFWSIAERTVVAAQGSAATLDSVASYWSALVAANADRLVEPGNPDLLHVAQTLVLPPVT